LNKVCILLSGGVPTERETRGTSEGLERTKGKEGNYIR
jgi:hypothetical protein